MPPDSTGGTQWASDRRIDSRLADFASRAAQNRPFCTGK